MYLCGLALFTAHGPAVASALIAFSNQMVSCSRGLRCWTFPCSRSPVGDRGDAADLGCVRGCDGDLQPADDFSELDLRDSARRRYAFRADRSASGSLDGPCPARQLGFSSDFRSPVRTWNEHHVGLL